jgi:hypothetical protein
MIEDCDLVYNDFFIFNWALSFNDAMQKNWNWPKSSNLYAWIGMESTNWKILKTKSAKLLVLLWAKNKIFNIEHDCINNNLQFIPINIRWPIFWQLSEKEFILNLNHDQNRTLSQREIIKQSGQKLFTSQESSPEIK